MNKAYNPIDWKNEPNTSTPINETNLNKMDRAIDTIDDRVIELDKNKVAKESGKGLSTNDFSYKYKETIDEMPEEFTIQNGYNYESGVFDSYLFMQGKSGTLPSGETYTLPVEYGEIAKETNKKIKDLAENGVFKNKERIDELNNNLGGLKFGIDANGNYGYIKAGADTVTPFSSGGGIGGINHEILDMGIELLPYESI